MVRGFHRSNRSIALLGDDDLGTPLPILVCAVDLFAVDAKDDVGVLLNPN